MIFNPEKYYTLHMYKPKTYSKWTTWYIMDGVTLKAVSHHPYPGVELQRDLKWKTHIDNITSKANKTLGLIKRNLHKCSQEVKVKGYTNLVSTKLEYSFEYYSVCFQHLTGQLSKIIGKLQDCQSFTKPYTIKTLSPC